VLDGSVELPLNEAICPDGPDAPILEYRASVNPDGLVPYPKPFKVTPDKSYDEFPVVKLNPSAITLPPPLFAGPVKFENV
jgi:hypothetical protein